jgi:hypothetical protein
MDIFAILPVLASAAQMQPADTTWIHHELIITDLRLEVSNSSDVRSEADRECGLIQWKMAVADEKSCNTSSAELVEQAHASREGGRSVSAAGATRCDLGTL